MIEKIILENYRCFKKHEIDLKPLTIIVGKNNAGKSTLIEALRLTSIVINRSKNLNFQQSPDWLDIQPKFKGVSPSTSGLDISTKNIFNNYGPPPAKITALLSNGCKVETFVGEDVKLFGIITDIKGKIAKSKIQVRNLDINSVNVLPQISPILIEETVLTYETIRSNLDSYLASRHFRNQIKYNYLSFDKFRNLAETSWYGLGIRDLDGRAASPGGQLSLLVNDGSFIAEIGWMGHGLQMWLQTIWFLARSEENSSIILDEPDVYLHADLQRKLIRLIKGKYKQIIIATHSVEIMSEVEPEHILVLDKATEKSNYANSISMLQTVIENIGSVQNLELIRLFSANKFLIVEGNDGDIKILSIFQDMLFQNSEDPFGSIPKIFIEGWGGWQRVVGSSKVFRDFGLADISIYCILDSDYHTEEEKNQRYDEAKKHDINLHIWEKKEIENYLIVPTAIYRYITKNIRKGKLELDDIIKFLNELSESCKQEIIGNIATEIHNQDRKLAIKTAYNTAREKVEKLWVNKKYSLLPGNYIIKKISNWSKDNYGVSISKLSLAREIKKQELDNEMKLIISKIEHCIYF